ncbi:MAG: NAD(P)/FAD-dependent oxidoreductase [Bacteroidota bacterium]
MEKFDVIIVGGGPAGLICAERLSKSQLSVLLLEKDDVFGDKVCAGGLTRKDLAILDIPDEIIGHKVHHTSLHSPARFNHTESPDPMVVTIDRKQLGAWQRSLLEGTSVTVMHNTRVAEVRKKSVMLDNGDEIGYSSLVGADGYASLVRRYLKLPQEKRIIGIQYMVPEKEQDTELKVFLDSRYFNAWYGWIFPHKDKISVGCGCDPRYYSGKRLKKNFHKWLDKMQIDISNATYESAPISYDYRGLRFDNIYLVGDAAGIASGLTGEGVYQSLVSGIEVAGYIMGQDEESDDLKAVLRYNRIQEKIMMFLIRIGPLRKIVFELIIMMMRNKRFKNRVNNGFS